MRASESRPTTAVGGHPAAGPRLRRPAAVCGRPAEVVDPLPAMPDVLGAHVVGLSRDLGGLPARRPTSHPTTREIAWGT
jgi:hypothetical protein